MLRLAIIGSGFGQYGLLPAFRSVKKCRVVAICGRKRKQLVAYCRSIGLKNIYDDWRVLLEREKLDAVAIAVTPDAQYQVAREAINRGLHVFAEKPLAATVAQAKELLLLARKKKIVHAVDFLFPEIAEWKKAKQCIDDRVLGRLQHLCVNWDFLSYDIRSKHASWKTNSGQGGGALAFYFSHGLHYLEHFAGEIMEMKSVFSHAGESINGGEVGVDMVLKFRRGMTGNARVRCNSRGLTRHQLTFYCNHGTIVLESNRGVVDHFIVKMYSLEGEKRVTVKKDRGKKGEDERVKIVRKIAQRFVKSCLARKQMSPSFVEGVRVQELIERARQHGE